MVAAAGWLSQLMAGEGPQRVQVIDEAWALLGNRHTARYLQTCFKLGRTHGVANLCVAHRPSDLGAQADDGTARAKIATGLLADELLGSRRGTGSSAMWRCPSPQHAQTGRTPPVSVFTSHRGEERWHCHGCGIGGSAVDLLMAVRGVSAGDALGELARRAGRADRS